MEEDNILKIIAGITVIVELINKLIEFPYHSIILVVGFIILFVMNIYTLNRNKIQTKKIHECHNKLSYYDKNLFFEMHRSYKRNIDISTFNDLFMEKINAYLEELAKLINVYARKNIVLTVRFFDEKKSNLEESILTILSHSEYYDSNRDKYYEEKGKKCPKKINENTEFLKLIDEKNKLLYFYESDLEKYDKSLRSNNTRDTKYKNETPNWEEFYISRVVVPIKIERKKLFYLKSDDGDDIIGFLIADVKSNKVFTEAKKNLYISIMQGYASRLYIILNKYNQYLNEMRSDSNDKKRIYN